MKEFNEKPSAAIFVDDGGPDAFEFVTNYIVFDPSDPSDRARAWADAERLWLSRHGHPRGGQASLPLRRPELTKQYPVFYEG